MKCKRGGSYPEKEIESDLIYVNWSIEGFIYEFTSNNLNTKGSDPNKSEVPFVHTMTLHDFKRDPIQEPIQVQIHWNGNKQTMPLLKK